MSTRKIFVKLFRNFSPTLYTSSMLFAYCTSPDKSNTDKKFQFKPLDLKKLTHEYMIKQSVLDTVNSTTNILTISYMAIIDLNVKYRDLVNQLISLYEEILMYDANEEHWDLIIKLRNEMQETTEKLVKLSNSMEEVTKIAIAISELSFFYDMENLGNTLLDRINDAINDLKLETEKNKQLEHAYWNIQEQCIRSSKESTKKQ